MRSDPLHRIRDTVRAYEDYLELMRFLEKRFGSPSEARMIGTDELEAMHEARLDAEIKMLDVKNGRWPVKEP